MYFHNLLRFMKYFFVFFFLFSTYCDAVKSSEYSILLSDAVADKKPLSWFKQQMDNLPEQNVFDDSAVFNYLEVFKTIRNVFIPFQGIEKLIEEYVNRFQEQFKPVKVFDHGFFQKLNVPVGSEIVIIGDLHGSAHTLLKIISNFVDESFKIVKNDLYIVFTGDYVDRGIYGIEVWYSLLRLKLANWDKVFILRGNHENMDQNLGSTYYFYSELVAKYGVENASVYIGKFSNVLYERIPLVLYLKSGDSWVQFCHAGIDPCFDVHTFLNSADMIKVVDFSQIGYGRDDIHNGFAWADFYGNGSTIEMNLNRLVMHGPFDTCDMIKWFSENEIKAIFRGHQHHLKGLSMFSEQTQLGGPIQWELVGTSGELISNKIYLYIHIPIFTFTTATEYGVADRPMYGILKTAEKFEGWTLTPVAIERGSIFRNEVKGFQNSNTECVSRTIPNDTCLINRIEE